MGYKVIKPFTDLQDGRYVYQVGDDFPRLGANVTQERIAELTSTKNRRKEVLVKEVNMAPERRRKRRNARTDSEVN